MSAPVWQALVLAGDRGAADPVAAHFGVPCKALAPLAGEPLLARVLGALDGAGFSGRTVLVGPRAEHLAQAPWLQEAVACGRLRWLAPEPGAAASAAAGVAALGAGPVLITTADHALLRADIVQRFMADALATGADAAVGLAAHEAVLAAFPGTRRTRIRLSDGAFCGCNLFAVLTPAGRRAVAFWQTIEQVRKRPLRIARLLGAGTLARYLAGRLGLREAFAALSVRAGAQVAPVLLNAPDAAVDVDSLADYRLAAWRVGELSAPR